MALARAFRWRRLIEAGVHTTIAEIATAEGVNPSYLSRVLRLTLLAPDIVETLLDHPQLPIRALLTPFPENWIDQRSLFANGERARDYCTAVKA
jgi:hypothetical protein